MIAPFILQPSNNLPEGVLALIIPSELTEEELLRLTRGEKLPEILCEGRRCLVVKETP